MSETVPAKDVVGSEDPRAFIWEMLRAQWRFSALYAFVELDLAGWLREEPLSVDALSERGGFDGGALARLLRTAAGIGLVRSLRTEGSPTRFALTPAGETLRGDVRRS